MLGSLDGIFTLPSDAGNFAERRLDALLKRTGMQLSFGGGGTNGVVSP